MEQPRIAIVLVNWNGKEDTRECLESLRRLTYPDYSLIVVDNGSTDGSVAEIGSVFPEVCLIPAGENLGFTGGNNIGIKRALDTGADAVLLLNNDTVVSPDFLEPLALTLFGDPKIGAVNSKIYYYAQPDVIWSAGGNINGRTGIASQRHVDEKDEGQADQQADVDYAVGCSIMVRRDAIEMAGLLDDDFFVYYEEAEWCRRMRALGYRIVYVPGSKVWHKVMASASSSERTLYYYCRNRLLYLRRDGARPARQAGLIALEFGRMALAFLVKGRASESRAVARAVTDYCFGKFGKAPI
ncbi:MAG: glycosyltransferase family 2 protein [Armatimonadota bacterium]|nr:glycosyltransferase family 2 protein [Armatimonadota bacterium]